MQKKKTKKQKNKKKTLRYSLECVGNDSETYAITSSR